MTTQEVMNYLETSLKPQIATLTEAINLALQSSSTVVANSSGAMAILSSALSATAGNVALENGVVVPNLKKMLDEVQAVSGSIQTESAQAIAELKEQSRTLIAQMSDAAQGINDSIESGVSSSTYSSGKIQALLAELKRTLESAIATAKDSLLETQTTQGEKITALESAKQDHAGKISALESAKSEQAEKIALLESAKATLESGVAEAKRLAQNAGVKSINGETGEITGVVKLTSTQTLSNKTLNAPILNNATLNGTTTLATATLSAPTLTDPKISLGEAGVGKAGQVLMSQGEGKAPKWKRITNEFIYLPEVGEEAEEEERARVIGVNEGNIITINPQDYTESIRLPDIATLEVGAQYSISNMGQYPVTICFAPNKILGSVATETTELLVVAKEQGRKFWQHNLNGFAYVKMFESQSLSGEWVYKIDNDRYLLFSSQTNVPVKYFDFKRGVKFEFAIHGSIQQYFIPCKIDEHTFAIASNIFNTQTVYFVNVSNGAISKVFNTTKSSQIKGIFKIDNFLLLFESGSRYTPFKLDGFIDINSGNYTNKVEEDYFLDMANNKLYWHSNSYFFEISRWNSNGKINGKQLAGASGSTPKSYQRTIALNEIELRDLNGIFHLGNQSVSHNNNSVALRYYNRTGALIAEDVIAMVAGEHSKVVSGNISFHAVSESDFISFSLNGTPHIFKGGNLTSMPKNITPILYDDNKMISSNEAINFSTKKIRKSRNSISFPRFSYHEYVAKTKTIARFGNKILLAQIADEQP